MRRWWRPVCRDVRVVEPGTGHGLGRVVELATRGFLPVVVRWRFRVVEARYPYASRYVADGGFVGTGAWTFAQSGETVRITYDWRVCAEHPAMRALGPVLRPLFVWNHDWAMARGERGLRAEVARRRAGRAG